VYLRETRRVNRGGSVVRYPQLARNERHSATGSPVAKVIHNFGRADNVDRVALSRLVASISWFLEPEQAAATAFSASPSGDAAGAGMMLVLPPSQASSPIA
jgi:hypothetical protein